MTTPFCSECNNTGEDAHSGWLACRAQGCAAAADRAALGAHLLALGPLTPYDREWEAYRLGQAKGASAAIEQVAQSMEAKGDYVWANTCGDFIRKISAPANNKPETAA